MYQLPSKIAQYFRKHFHEVYLSDIKLIKDSNNNKYFKIEIIENDLIHHVEFKKNGDLIKHETKPLFENEIVHNSVNELL